jgi:hypothetical protein
MLNMSIPELQYKPSVIQEPYEGDPHQAIVPEVFLKVGGVLSSKDQAYRLKITQKSPA